MGPAALGETFRPQLRRRRAIDPALRQLIADMARATIATAVADVADIPRQSHVGNRVDGFLTVPTITGRLLFVFIVLSHDPYVERALGSLRRECLDHVLVFNEIHLRRILRAYVAYYHRSRTHLALDKDAPDSRTTCSGAGTIRMTPEVGGLHHRYDRQAA